MGAWDLRRGRNPCVPCKLTPTLHADGGGWKMRGVLSLQTGLAVLLEVSLGSFRCLHWFHTVGV